MFTTLPTPEQHGYDTPAEQLAYYRGAAAGQQAAQILLGAELGYAQHDNTLLVGEMIARDGHIATLEKEKIDLGFERDAIEVESLQREMHHRDRAERNPLTGLYNQEAFAERVNEYMSPRHRRSSDEQSGILFFIDLDYLGVWNDILQEPVVNKIILVPMAEKFRELVRSEDIIGHWGGDEFAIYANGMSRKDAKRYGEKIRTAINSIPVTNPSDTGPQFLGVSTGYTQTAAGEEYTDAEIRAARAKKYVKAELGRNEIMDYINVPIDYDFALMSQKSIDAIEK